MAISTAEYPTAAPRPLNSRLALDKVQRTFGLQLPHWTAGVNRLLDEILPG